MIVEALQHLFIRCPRPLKRLGVLHGLIAIEARHRRWRAAWAPHLAQARAAALDFADTAPGRRLAVVAGSGLLLDVPLADLARRFDRVVLVDLFHMPAVRRAAAAFSNVDLVAHDMSGVIDGLRENLKAGRLPEPCASIPYADEADYLLSANCLSQIPIDPMAAAWTTPGFTPDAVIAWGRRMIEGHLEVLRAAAGAAALVTDVQRAKIEKGSEEMVEWWDLLEGAPEPDVAARREWWWNIAPAPEEYPRHDIRHRVIAGLVRKDGDGAPGPVPV